MERTRLVRAAVALWNVAWFVALLASAWLGAVGWTIAILGVFVLEAVCELKMLRAAVISQGIMTRVTFGGRYAAPATSAPRQEETGRDERQIH